MIGETMMKARAAFPGMQIESTAFREALMQRQEERAWEQLKTQKEMFIVEQQRMDEEAVLRAAMEAWAAKMAALTKGLGGTKQEKFPYAQVLQSFGIKRDMMSDVDKRIKEATVQDVARSFGPRLNMLRIAAQSGDMDEFGRLMNIIQNEYYTEPKTMEAFSTAGIVGAQPKLKSVEGVRENIKMEITNTPMSAMSSKALNNAKQRFSGESAIRQTGVANFITDQVERPFWGGVEPNWWQWTRDRMPEFVRDVMVELYDNLNAKVDEGGILTNQEATVLNGLKSMAGNWNAYADDFVESIMNPGARRNMGKAAIVDMALNNAGISTEIFGYISPEHKEAAGLLQQYMNVEATERGMVEEYARDYPNQFREYAQIKGAVGMIDDRDNQAYLVNLDNLRQLQGIEYEDRMEQTGENMIRDFRNAGLMDRLQEFAPGISTNTILEYLNDISEANVMGEKERAREILMGRPGEYEGFVDLWMDKVNVTPDFIADFVNLFYRHGVLESPNPLDISRTAEKYRGLDIFSEEEKMQQEEFYKTRKHPPRSGATAILEFLRAKGE
jgi:hypothetical protein